MGNLADDFITKQSIAGPPLILSHDVHVVYEQAFELTGRVVSKLDESGGDKSSLHFSALSGSIAM